MEQSNSEKSLGLSTSDSSDLESASSTKKQQHEETGKKGSMEGFFRKYFLEGQKLSEGQLKAAKTLPPDAM